MFVQGLELSAVRYHSNVTCLYRDWNCLRYDNIAKLHVCTGTVTVCSTVTLQHYMLVQGLEICSTITLQRYMFVQGLELSAVR